MDSFTHLVAGALTPLAFRNAPKSAVLVLFGLTAGVFPDVDVFFGSSPEALMNIHRGLTHALAVQPVFALLLALPFFALLTRRGPGGSGEGWRPPLRGPGWRESLGGFGFRGLFLAGLAALCLHLYLDCMTTFGTRVFLPFSSFRLGLPAMFIIDILCTLPALWLLGSALKPRKPAPSGRREAREAPASPFFPDQTRRYARLGLAWLLCYPLACLAVNAASTLYLESLPADGASPAEKGRLTLLTEPFSPFVWKVVEDEGDLCRLGIFDLSAGMLFQNPERFAKPPQSLLDSLAGQAAIFTSFRDFCAHLIFRETPEETGTLYSFMDLRYVVAEYSPLRLLFGRTKTLFVLEARVDRQGRLLAYRFLRDSEQRDTPWFVRTE
ncbi:MAG: metal-dependent hydrolase [Desulfovibrio sp.]|jgi:inner membrane protein|nr:metal-dependent hydrolase [Desulfovibrio sp.]